MDQTPPLRPPVSGRFQRLEFLVLACIALVFAGLVWVASPQVRGTDQYWYVADVDTLAQGRGPITNNTFPPSVIPVLQRLPRPLVHNIPNLYLVAPLAARMDPHRAWVLANILATVATAFLIYGILAAGSGPRPALAAALIWLALPLTPWQASQALAEATMAPWVALAILLFARPKLGPLAWLGLTFVVAFLAICRTSMVPLLPLLAAAMLWRERGSRQRWLLLAAMVLLSLAMVEGWHAFAKPNLNLGMLDYLRTGAGNDGNMASFFKLDKGPLTLAMLAGKAMGSLRTQFLAGLRQQAFFLPVNLLLAMWLALKVRSRQWNLLDSAAAAMVVIHFLTILVFQNQPRYALPLLPALIPAAVSAAREAGGFDRKMAAQAVIGILVLAVLGSGALLVRTLRRDALQETVARTALLAALKGPVSASDRVMVEADGSYILMAYVLRPNPVLLVRDDYTAAQYEQLVRNFAARWLLCRDRSPMLASIHGRVPVPLRLAPPFQNLVLVELP